MGRGLFSCVRLQMLPVFGGVDHLVDDDPGDDEQGEAGCDLIGVEGDMVVLIPHNMYGGIFPQFALPVAGAGDHRAAPPKGAGGGIHQFLVRPFREKMTTRFLGSMVREILTMILGSSVTMASTFISWSFRQNSLAM